MWRCMWVDLNVGEMLNSESSGAENRIAGPAAPPRFSSTVYILLYPMSDYNVKFAARGYSDCH